jgi:hypothetical protein
MVILSQQVIVGGVQRGPPRRRLALRHPKPCEVKRVVYPTTATSRRRHFIKYAIHGGRRLYDSELN